MQLEYGDPCEYSFPSQRYYHPLCKCQLEQEEKIDYKEMQATLKDLIAILYTDEEVDIVKFDDRFNYLVTEFGLKLPVNNPNI